VASLLEALAFFQKCGVTHHDLKLGNVMFDARGHLKVLDFGLASVMREDDIEVDGQRGALNVRPPEAFDEETWGFCVNHSADIWCAPRWRAEVEVEEK
jgi:serine/threonine protein kinase